ncbi:hypothetical protein ILUMI_16345, partial [Ignelater luminosus]
RKAQRFFDSFKVLVHEDETLSKIKKFHYLRGCLKDDALRAIESLSVSNDNYDSAIELLKRRFENERLIVQEHVTNTRNVLHIKSSNQVLLSTVMFLIIDSRGKSHNCRALLDQCSEVNIITTALSKKLNLIPRKVNASISGVNLNNTIVSENINVTIKSRITDFATNFDCFVLPAITNPTPSITFDKSFIELPSNVKLADPDFNVSRDIDLLIGAQLFWGLLIDSPIQLKKDQPIFKTQTSSDQCLELQVAKFWEHANIIEPNPGWSVEQMK